jgi:hypothetical protein
MRHDLRFHFLSLNITNSLIDFRFFITRFVSPKQIDGSVPIFDLLHYEKNLTHKYLSTFIQRLVPHFYKTDDVKCDISENVKPQAVVNNTQLSVGDIALV